jgi:predicted secreted protein
MTTGNTTIGHGTVFNLISGSTTTPINGVLSFDFGSNKVDTLDTTTMSTSGNARSYQGGLEDPGDATLKLDYLPTDTSQATLYTAKDGTVHSFSVVWPAAISTETFSGIITSIDKSGPDDKLVTLSVKIKLTGARTLA